MEVKRLFSYCLKSSRGRKKSSVFCKKTGFLNDRAVAIIDENQKIITGREYPQLLGFLSSIDQGKLELISDRSEKFSFVLPKDFDCMVEVKLFRNTVSGHLFSDEENKKVSELLKGRFRLLYIGDCNRPLPQKRGGKEGESTAYADSAPVHLINMRTLKYLNTQLTENVSDKHFRPNLVVDGISAFEEDSWSLIEINGLRFRVQERTQRCIFTTIHPKTHQKNGEIEPLKTIAKFRSETGARPTFGINLVPLEEGHINLGDIVNIIKRV